MSAPATHTLGKSRRLTLSSDVARVRHQGARIEAGPWVVHCFQRGDDRPARFSATPTRKAGNAVARNRIRRLLREAFRTAPESFPPGIDLWVLVRAPCVGWTLEDVRERLASALRRALQRGNRPPRDA